MVKTVAFIPLRYGSKGIPMKNIKLIAGKPLCAWVIESACQSNVFDEIYISTDSEAIAKVVQSLGLSVKVIMRPLELATDEATTESAILHFANNVDFDVVATVQATSPLTEPKDFKNATLLFSRDNLDSLLSGVRIKRFIWDEKGVPLNYNPVNRPRRQEFKGSILENGAFYLTHRDILMKTKSRLGGVIGIYEMPDETSIELDESEDWNIVENLLKEKNKNRNLKKLSKIKLLAMDCDGVLTDGGMYYDKRGEVIKKFNTRDGKGLELLREKGILTAIITGESSKALEYRAEKLKIDHLYQSVTKKELVLLELMEKYNFKTENIAYVGDDLGDLTAMETAGIKFAVEDAVNDIKQKADIILTSKGGKCAVREICDLLLETLK